MEFLSLLREFGPLAGIVLFFIWRDWKREDRSASRIEKLEDEMRHIIMPLVERSAKVISKNSQIMRENAMVMRELGALLGKSLTKTLRQRKTEGPSEPPKPE